MGKHLTPAKSLLSYTLLYVAGLTTISAKPFQVILVIPKGRLSPEIWLPPRTSI